MLVKRRKTMIVRRTKHFVDREDRFYKPTPFDINPKWENYPSGVVINTTKEFDKEYEQRAKLSSVWKQRVRSLRRSLVENNIYDDKEPSEMTHYYKEESTNKRYYVSKDINSNDRLMYDVREPYLDKDENGDPVVITEVTLRHCTGHTHRDGKKFSQVN